MTTGPRIWAMICVVWLLAIVASVAMVLRYQATAGTAGRTPERWLTGTQLALDRNQDTLIMFVHPQCPCTRASVEELNHLLAQAHGHVTAHVCFFKPDNFPDNWTRTDLWRSVTAIPGVTAHEDRNGMLAKVFGAETSGYVVLYDRQGRLLFNGGITGNRGHVGDNPGESTIISLLAGQADVVKETPVYGCSLLACPSPAASK